MTYPRPAPAGAAPHVVATGFTTAFLGDERTLREFVVGDHVVRGMRARGQSAVLYLVNDTYDPLTDRQLRIGVKKDERLMTQFEPFCGRPIAEVPDPFDCHSSYAEHFLQALLDRLNTLDVHPVVLDTYRTYRSGGYAPYVSLLFEHYDEIVSGLADRFEGLGRRDLFRLQCPRCSRLDATEIREVSAGSVAFHCRRCGVTGREGTEGVRGKLSWKLDCAARWNLYRIETETFAKEHQAVLGTLNVSRFMSREFYGGRVPGIVRYGALRIDLACAGRLLEILPPAVFKAMLTEHLSRDLELTPDSVRHFCTKFDVTPGVSYVDFVHRELPRRALHAARSYGDPPPAPCTRGAGLVGGTLVGYANRFSEFYYGKHYALRLPSRTALEGVPTSTASAARDVIAFALAARGQTQDAAALKEAIRSWLALRDSSPRVYPFLRRLFGQTDGPNVTTMLAILPCDFLETVHLVLSGMTGDLMESTDPVREDGGEKRAA